MLNIMCKICIDYAKISQKKTTIHKSLKKALYINLNEGLCNGTRLLIHYLHNNTINAEVLAGSCANQTVLIPRIVLSPSSTELPFILSRRQ